MAASKGGAAGSARAAEVRGEGTAAAWVGVAVAAVLIVGVLIDAFEVMILPRRGDRLARLFYPSAWVLWRPDRCQGRCPPVTAP